MKSMRFGISQLFCAAIACASLFVPSLAAANTPATPSPLRIVALSNTVHQGTTGPRSIGLFNAVHIDGAGFATFDTYYSPGSFERGIWSERDGVLKEIVHTNDPHPATVSPYHFWPHTAKGPLSTESTVFFFDEFADVPGSSMGVWVSAPGQPMRMAGTTEPSPLIIAPRFSNGGGNDLFFGNGTSTGYLALQWNRNFVYESSPDNSLRLVVSQANTAPGVQFGTFFDVGNPAVNDSGQIAWDGTLNTGNGIVASNNEGIWKQLTPGVGTLVVREGNPATGTPNVPFGRIETFTINNDGGVVLVSELATANAASDVGIFREKVGVGLQPIMIEGDAAPGTALGVTFGNINRLMQPFYDRSGNVAFSSNLVGPGVTSDNDSGVWAHNGSQGLRMVVREGDPAPGTEPGVVFEQFNNQMVNANGQVAFFGYLRGPGIDSNVNDRGVWVEGPQGLTLVARRGDYYTSGIGDVFRLGSPQSFSIGANGHFVFRAFDFDGTTGGGIFVVGAAAIPEPTSLFAACVGGLVCCAVGRRRRA
jgi:hypothetical protein